LIIPPFHLPLWIPVFFHGEMVMTVRSVMMDSVLDINGIFSDRTITRQIRDAYPIAIFHLDLFLMLFENELSGEAMYLRSRATVFGGLFSDTISQHTGIFVLEIVLELLVILKC
jgi:hypothetical protein